ncbi:hypothetical protein, partial [Flavobacterium branchiophilum]|uniref:hypothetical protein n=1 Tax=Flavobacterium branchiophilum TaxID=55197 RepID=UPI001CBDBB5E
CKDMSPQPQKGFFCCCKRATSGSSFCGKQKTLLGRGLETECWMGYNKKLYNQKNDTFDVENCINIVLNIKYLQ